MEKRVCDGKDSKQQYWNEASSVSWLALHWFNTDWMIVVYGYWFVHEWKSVLLELLVICCCEALSFIASKPVLLKY